MTTTRRAIERNGQLIIVRSAKIEAPVARALMMMDGIRNGTLKTMSVKDAHDASEALRDPENQHVCGLCGDIFDTAMFIAHVDGCIRQRAPRRRYFPLAAGLKGVIAAFPDRVRIKGFKNV
jgi:hypothetical protein